MHTDRGVSRAAEPPPPMSEKILRFPSRRRDANSFQPPPPPLTYKYKYEFFNILSSQNHFSEFFSSSFL
jgi:hypothetical protein